MALLGSASVSSAADCASDPNECTLKKLCEASTTLDGSNTIWATTSETAKHVALAQSLGMECGVTPIVDLCETDPSECKVSEICEKATTKSAGQKTWDDSAAGHVALAKEYGLTCGVGEANAATVKTGCSVSNVAACDAAKLCLKATDNYQRKISWAQFGREYVKEAKKRGLTCGVGEVKAASVYGECSSSNIDGCTDVDLCRLSTGYISSTGPWYAIKDTKVWSDSKYYANHVKEAKKRGLTCGVGTKAANFKKAFTSQSRLKRKQLQYALKKLGYYSYGIDGLWGKGTSSAFVKFVSGNGLKGKSESQVFSSLLSKVDVPSSFAAPKKKVTASTTSNGWRSFSANPRYSYEQAEAICKPRASNAYDNASQPQTGTSFSCNSWGSNINCRDSSGPANATQGLLLGIANAFTGRDAAKAVMTSCMAEYGWTK